ncbi:VOC family protein [Psychroflexus aestuariivivens]|uniref:VOC family protein n=1 Tax=Psychroflexus aestuariivivens TaxID=1795040 RepID=UPI000FD8B61A|nr:VOC family protein [Psychroflexus aestuariivivens]
MINTYLNFNGNCESAFEFYKSVFGGEFDYIGRFGEMPAQENMPEVSDEDKNRIMHISYKIGETTLMGSDTMSEMGEVKFGDNFAISINAKSKTEADNFFSKLSEDGEIIMPLQDTFWGAYFGQLKDKFGINWMVNFDL